METNRIHYSITFLSEWHAGSGLSSGASADAVVIKDRNNLPYLPGKTIKGLLKDVFYDFKDLNKFSDRGSYISEKFGDFNEKDNKSDKGSWFFSNAILPEKEKSEISLPLSQYLYKNISSTKISDTGIAENGSLRVMEVCIPLTLEGYIDGVDLDDVEILKSALMYLRYIGANRNRGLGRCKIQIKDIL